MTSRSVYPDWVKKFRVRGTVIKRKDNSYYLYKRTSKRVPGKKYPQAVDTYIGVITKDGVVGAEKKLVPASGKCKVMEYGFSHALMSACPEEWKKAVGKQWKDILKIIICDASANSYLKEEKLPDKENMRVAWNAQYASLLRLIRNTYHVERKDLEKLKFVYIVSLGKKKYLSIVNEEQQKILSRLNVSALEVH